MKKLIWLLLLLVLCFPSIEAFTQEIDPFEIASRIALVKGKIVQNDAEEMALQFKYDGLAIRRCYIRRFQSISDEVSIMIIDMKAGVIVTLFKKEQWYYLDKYNPNVGPRAEDMRGNRVDAEIAKFMAAAILRKYLSATDLQGI